MREILFRGKSKVRGDWVEGCLVRRYNGYVGIDRPHPDLCFELIQVEPETVGQYTGLTGKNGKKVFEGDVLQVKTNGMGNRIFPVYFGEYIDADNVFDDYRCMGFYLKQLGKCCTLGALLTGDFEFEVIGNIFDNSLEELQNGN